MAIKSPKHGLTRHVRGGWYKSINGDWKQVAGKLEAPTPEEADRVYERRFATLWGGANIEAMSSPDAPVDEATLKSLYDQYAHNNRLRVAAGTMKKRTADEYEDVLFAFLELVGQYTRFHELKPHDFTRVYQRWSVTYKSPTQRGKYVAIVRTWFNWLDRQNFISEPPDYGDFCQPTRAAFRLHQADREEQGGQTTFAPEEIAALIAKADTQMLACVLLGLNGGFGNTDLSELRLRTVDLKKGWVDYARGKTGVKRRCPLWPETIAAIEAALPLCKITGNVFSTSDGRPLVQGTHDRLAARFKTLCEHANCYVEDRGFYALKHTFASTAVQFGSTLLVKRITGHTNEAEDRVLSEHYVGKVDPALCEIVTGVRHVSFSHVPRNSLVRQGEPLTAAASQPLHHQPSTPRSGGGEKRTRART